MTYPTIFSPQWGSCFSLPPAGQSTECQVYFYVNSECYFLILPDWWVTTFPTCVVLLFNPNNCHLCTLLQVGKHIRCCGVNPKVSSSNISIWLFPHVATVTVLPCLRVCILAQCVHELPTWSETCGGTTAPVRQWRKKRENKKTTIMLEMRNCWK